MAFYHVALTLVTLFFFKKITENRAKFACCFLPAPAAEPESIHSQQAFSRHKSKAVGSHSLISCPLHSQLRLFNLRFLLRKTQFIPQVEV